MKKIPMLEKFAAQSLVESDGELIFSKEKFAELIVRECIAKAEEESERYLTWNTEDCNRFSKVMQNYKELLKEHFGVE
jgi:hypothetical protein